LLATDPLVVTALVDPDELFELDEGAGAKTVAAPIAITSLVRRLNLDLTGPSGKAND
jgi:hypothetical protein